MQKGYLKDALINFIALLGWNAGDDKEYYTMDELINAFSLERVNKAGAIFNLDKLDWLNAEHLRSTPNDKILIMLKDEISKSNYSNFDCTDEYLLLIIEAMKERVSFVKEYIEKCPYFFEPPIEYDEKVVKKRWKDDSQELLKIFSSRIEQLVNPRKEDYERILKKLCEEKEIGLGRLIHPLRLALSGVGIGPGIFDLIFILGKEESLKRIDKALDQIK